MNSAHPNSTTEVTIKSIQNIESESRFSILALGLFYFFFSLDQQEAICNLFYRCSIELGRSTVTVLRNILFSRLRNHLKFYRFLTSPTVCISAKKKLRFKKMIFAFHQLCLLTRAVDLKVKFSNCTFSQKNNQRIGFLSSLLFRIRKQIRSFLFWENL